MALPNKSWVAEPISSSNLALKYMGVDIKSYS